MGREPPQGAGILLGHPLRGLALLGGYAGFFLFPRRGRGHGCLCTRSVKTASAVLTDREKWDFSQTSDEPFFGKMFPSRNGGGTWRSETWLSWLACSRARHRRSPVPSSRLSHRRKRRSRRETPPTGSAPTATSLTRLGPLTGGTPPPGCRSCGRWQWPLRGRTRRASCYCGSERWKPSGQPGWTPRRNARRRRGFCALRDGHDGDALLLRPRSLHRLRHQRHPPNDHRLRFFRSNRNDVRSVRSIEQSEQSNNRTILLGLFAGLRP